MFSISHLSKSFPMILCWIPYLYWADSDYLITIKINFNRSLMLSSMQSRIKCTKASHMEGKRCENDVINRSSLLRIKCLLLPEWVLVSFLNTMLKLSPQTQTKIESSDFDFVGQFVQIPRQKLIVIFLLKISFNFSDFFYISMWLRIKVVFYKI